MAVRAARWALLVSLLACLVTACGTGGSAAQAPPAGPSAPASSLPRAEGTLRLLARQGYAESSWVLPFERSTGCRVEVRYADGAESLRRAAGAYAFDVASIPGSVAYAVVQDGAARALNPALVPQRSSFRAPFRDPAAGRAGARRYGVSFLWTPRLEIWRKSIRRHAPATWAPLAWNTKARLGRVALEDTPLEIGDAAVSLRKLEPALGITDPYALNEVQFAAAVALTKRRLHLAGALWQLPGDEIDAFDGGLVDVGAGDWYTAGRIRAQNVDVGLTLPREGAAGEVDLWMLGAHALHPGCAYRWMRYASTARVQARVARFYGATPVNAGACAALGASTCRALHADAAGALLKRIAFRHTPVENCGGGRICVPFARWEQSWTGLRSS
ncbi:MAG: putative spermidine/putrescine transport system substrate-binding protein [Gaiellales bacterium]|jgi:putative spermidine/putrescine transport system substrate-binding protein|nr:putative spermidine/putrescine transport system substrate-binding protein [Gaiellales bacterium]